MVDFHTHILPSMDDGSKDVSMSLQMLHMERELGVEALVLTPHFYASRNNPARFLQRRSRSWQTLWENLDDSCPQLLLGAEVQFFDNMNNAEEITSLCIEDTGVMLLEMPFCPWNERIIRTVLNLQGRGDIQLVLAHIERYRAFCKDEKVWQELRESGILMQVNCSLFSGWLGRRKAMKRLEKDEFQLIGSDCHNLDTRKPNWNLVPQEAAEAAGDFAKDLLGL